MSKIAEKFSQLCVQGDRALVTFITAGDPSAEALGSVLDALHEGGADIIEVGVPFSDPIADGPTIQAASQRALDRGVTPSMVLEAIASWAGQGKPPVVLMGYYNPVLRQGLEEFARSAAGAGVDGTIISDLTPEESKSWCATSRKNGLDTIFLAAPTSTNARLESVCRHSSGFVYAVSRTGVTGAGSEAPAEVGDLVSRIKCHTDLPVCVGFGISTPDHVRRICHFADGAVVGSVLVDLIAREWELPGGRDRIVATVRALKDATRLSE